MNNIVATLSILALGTAAPLGPGAPQQIGETALPDGGDSGLRVMSFNLRYGTADDGEDSWRYRRDLVVQVIEDAGPDIIGTQEALRFQLDELEEALPGYGEVGVGREDGVAAGEYSAILYRTSRLRVDEHGTFWFSETPEVPGSIAWGARFPRICTWSRFVDRSSGRGFYVFNVHLDHESQESRERSVELLLARIEARERSEPVIVTGDFNAGEDNPAMRRLLDAGAHGGPSFRDSFRVAHPDATDVGTFHGFEGGTGGPKIDAVLVSDAWEVVSASIIRASRDGRYPSDHFPVMAEVRLAGGGGSVGAGRR